MALNSVGKNSRNVLLLNTSSIVQSNQSFKNSTATSFVTHDLTDRQCGITLELAVDKLEFKTGSNKTFSTNSVLSGQANVKPILTV